MFCRKEGEEYHEQETGKTWSGITSGGGCRNHADEKGGMKSRNPETKAQREKELKEFRNTERGRQAKKQQGHFIIPTATTRAFPRAGEPGAWMKNPPISVGSGLAAPGSGLLLVRDRPDEG